MIEWLIAFMSIFCLDIVYTYYLKSVECNQALKASLWSVACYLLGSIAIVSYTTNHWLILPAVLGAFCGTFVGMKIRK